VRHSDSDDIERWVTEDDLGMVESKLLTYGANLYPEKRDALHRARDRIQKSRAKKVHDETVQIAQKANRHSRWSVLISLAALLVSIVAVVGSKP
jgi:hypothetical protein